VLLLPPQLCVLTIRRRLKLRLLQSASEISFRFRQDAKCFHWHASNSLSFSSCKCVWAVVCGCVVVEPLAVICMPLKLCKVILSRPQAKSAPIFAIVKVISGFKCELHLSCAQPPAPPPFSLLPLRLSTLLGHICPIPLHRFSAGLCCQSKYLATLSGGAGLQKVAQLNGQLQFLTV